MPKSKKLDEAAMSVGGRVVGAYLFLEEEEVILFLSSKASTTYIQLRYFCIILLDNKKRSNCLPITVYYCVSLSSSGEYYHRPQLRISLAVGSGLRVGGNKLFNMAAARLDMDRK